MIKINTVLDGILRGWIDRFAGTQAVRDMVNHQFAHAIDPKAGDAGVQAHLNAIHNSNSGPKPRC